MPPNGSRPLALLVERFQLNSPQGAASTKRWKRARSALNTLSDRPNVLVQARSSAASSSSTTSSATSGANSSVSR